MFDFKRRSDVRSYFRYLSRALLSQTEGREFAPRTINTLSMTISADRSCSNIRKLGFRRRKAVEGSRSIAAKVAVDHFTLTCFEICRLPEKLVWTRALRDEKRNGVGLIRYSCKVRQD